MDKRVSIDGFLSGDSGGRANREGSARTQNKARR